MRQVIMLIACVLFIGCGTETTAPDGRTRIFGNVIDSNSDQPAFGLGLGVLYESGSAGPDTETE